MNSKPIVGNPTLLALGDLLHHGESVKRVAGDGISALDAWVTANASDVLNEAYKRVCRNTLRLYRALPEVLPFHRSDFLQRIVIGSNQAGKTSAGVSEVTRIILGQHPLFPPNGGIALCVGLDDNHLAQNMWKELSSEGAFDCIVDPGTKLPRAVRIDPNNRDQIDPYDIEHKDEWFPSPPFLPSHEWDHPDGIAWRDRQIGSPAVVRIKSTGWTMLWHPSGGNPRRGIKIDLAWFDEETSKEWFFETIPRLMRRNGRFIWTATPQTGNEELMQLMTAAQEGSEFVHCTTLLIEDNPYIPEAQKRIAYETYKRMSDEDLEVRWYGRSAMLGRKVYPQYNPRELWVQGY